MDCKHDISLLMGTKDGIVCHGCQKLFASFAEIEADRGEAPATAPAEEKKAPATKKTASKKAKKED